MIVHGEFCQKNGDDPTEAWTNIRLGKITASDLGRVVQLSGVLRNGEMPTSYMCEKLYERWTGRAKPGKWLSMAVNNGLLVEQKAALFAEMEYGLQIQHVGFVEDDAKRCGSSPDGLIGWDGILSDKPTEAFKLSGRETGMEIKCVALDKWILESELPSDHLVQVQASMYFSGCYEWHFLSYPLACYLDGFPPLHLVIERDEKFCANLAESLDLFLQRYDEAFEILCEKNGGPPKRFVPSQPKPDPTLMDGIPFTPGN